MRILHTIDSQGIYGAETMLLNLAREQQRTGSHPIILSIGNLSAGIKAIEIEAEKHGIECVRYRMRDGFNLSGARAIRRIASDQRVDVMHSHGYKTNILFAMTASGGERSPVVATLHGWTAKKTLSKMGLYRFMDQRLLYRLDGVILVNEQMLAVPAVSRLERSRVYSIANGISLERKPLPIDSGDLVVKEVQRLRESQKVIVAAVGRLSPEKSFGTLVEAIRRMAACDTHVGAVILGDGPDAAELRRQIEHSGLTDQVILGGYVADARQYLELFDLLVIPSLTEGLPMILLEAMLTNLPVIASAVGDIPRVLGELGTTVRCGDAVELADTITRVVSNLDLHRCTAAGGSTRVAEHFSAAAMAASYDEVYRSVLLRKRVSH